jgi:hypothetical protein
VTQVKFYCAEDIENLAAQGKKELILDENTALTDLARDMARQMGIEIVNGSQAAAARPATASGGRSQGQAALPARPKGCKHGPLSCGRREMAQPNGSKTSGAVVDQLVDLVRQSSRRPSTD